MNKLILVTTIAIAMLSTSAMANVYTRDNSSVSEQPASVSTNSHQQSVDSAIVTDHYKNVIQQQPYNVEVCKQVRKQNNYYNNGTNSATNELFGAVIGGAIGNKFGKGDGKDAMTLFGALIGASMANDQQKLQQQHQGYTVSTVCNIETRYKETVRKVYSHSTISFVSNGSRYNVDFTK